MKNVVPIIGLLALGIGQTNPAEEDRTGEAATGPNPLVTGDGRTFAGRLAPHDSIYFLYGSDDPAAKFQFSFKYRLFDSQKQGGLPKATPSVNLAFTQRSLWDTEADSSPFYDTSYMPEIIFESSPQSRPKESGAFTWFGYQAAYKHESNGRDGLDSRSLDTLYFRPIFSIGPLDSWHAIFVPEVFVYATSLDNNPDLPDYRGYGQLRGAIAHRNGPALGYTIRYGKDFDRMTYQLDLTFPIKVDFLDLAAYLHIQYFDGYGESLRSYREESEALRFGISLVR